MNINIKYLLKEIKSYISCIFGLPYLYGVKSYSQEGEDIIIEKYFKNRNTGSYLDIGAYHPYKYSNTYKLYKKGWHGINIDASKKSIRLFNMVRVRDTNILAYIGRKNTDTYLYEFEDGVFNTLVKRNMEAVVKAKQSILINKHSVSVTGINEIIRKYVKSKKVDFLNIDTEGMSNYILRSIDYKRCKPLMIAVEKEYMGMGIKNDGMVNFMESKGYALLFSSPMTHIFELIDQL